MIAAAAVAAAVVAAVGLALGVGRAIRIADEREGLADGPLPARLNPRAGAHAEQDAQRLFTVLLVVLVLAGLGYAGSVDVAAVGGAA